MLLIAASTFTLTGHAPTMGGGCGAGTIPVRELLTVEVSISPGQSPRWRDSSAVMLADPAAFARNWPVVVNEAALRVLSRRFVMPGDSFNIAVPDSAGREYCVRVLNSRGSSCWQWVRR